MDKYNNSNRNKQNYEKNNNNKKHVRNNVNKNKPQRRRRVNIDRNTEVIIVNNTFGAFFYSNPRMTEIVDMENYGDEQYITVGDLRIIANTSKSVLESFSLLIVDILDDQYELEDLLNFLGLLDKYEEFYNLGDDRGINNINNFILKSPFKTFESTINSVNSKLRDKIIQNSVLLFRTKKLNDYQKISAIEEIVGEDVMLDAKEVEVDENLSI